MNCRNAQEFLLARLDAPLAVTHEAALVQHLQGCAGCGEQARQMEVAARWLNELPAEEPSENFEWRLKLRLAQATTEPQPEVRLGRISPAWSLRFVGAAAAAALVVVALGAGIFRASVPGDVPAGAAPAVTAGPHSGSPRTGHPGLPTLAVRPAYMRIVPTSNGAPLGPYSTQPPAPSILGAAVPDTAGADR
jgi:anti-sigma factor RsiW